jgi:hypothetical protein
MNARLKKLAAAVAAAVVLLGSASACAEIADPDKVGLWYAQGQSDGNKFDHCVKPGKSDDVSFNDSVYWLPNSLRTWNIAPEGGDSKLPLQVVAAPEAGQTSGLQVNVWVSVNFMLNTWCGADDKDENSPFVQWWQKLGDRYDADTDAGWVNMLNATVVPALEKAKNVLRSYTADQLVSGNVTTKAEGELAKTFSEELERVSGGDYFCGPDFNRGNANCSPVAVLLKDVDITDTSVLQARNEKQKALELAAARVADAQGQVQAADAQKQLYNNPAWVQLQLAQKNLEIAQACAASSKCTMVLDSSGNVQVHTS